MNGAIPASLLGAAVRKMPLTLEKLKAEMAARSEDDDDEGSSPKALIPVADLFDGKCSYSHAVSLVRSFDKQTWSGRRSRCSETVTAAAPLQFKRRWSCTKLQSSPRRVLTSSLIPLSLKTCSATRICSRISLHLFRARQMFDHSLLPMRKMKNLRITSRLRCRLHPSHLLNQKCP